MDTEISGTPRYQAHPRKTPLIVLALALSATAVGADPIVDVGAEAQINAVLSTHVDEFWSAYPQFVAENSPFLSTWFGIHDGNRWSIKAEFDFQQQYVGWRDTNLPLPDADSRRAFPVEYHGLHQGDLTYNFDPLVVSIGRNKVHWGATEDSFIVANQIPFLDRLSLHLPMGSWVLDDFVAAPENRTGTMSEYGVTTYQVAHRLSWHNDGLEIGFTEQAILDRNKYDSSGAVTSNGGYSLTDFLPFFSVHQADLKPFNTMTILDVSWKLGAWRLAFESGLDDFDARMFGIADDSIPNIPANLFEVTWAQDAWSSSVSIGNTHYLWGNFDTYYGKSIYRIFLDNGVQEQPLTSPYGPGATWITASLRYQGPHFGFDGRVEFWAVQKGVTLNIAYPGTSPAAGFNDYGRAHFFATFSDQYYSLQLGPQVLLTGGQFTEQLCIQLSSSLGSRPPGPANQESSY